MVDFYIFTRQTGSLRQKPGRYGSPGRAVMVHLIKVISFNIFFAKDSDQIWKTMVLSLSVLKFVQESKKIQLNIVLSEMMDGGLKLHQIVILKEFCPVSTPFLWG